MRYQILLTVVIASGCTDAPCSNVERADIPSPSGSLHAVIFSRECGATVGRNTQLSVLPAAVAPVGGGNVLILKGDAAPEVRWKSDTDLEIGGVASIEHYKLESMIGTVHITFR